MVPAAGLPEHIDAAGSKKRLAVFVSGGGSNFKAIHAACQRGAINAEVVVSSRQAVSNVLPNPKQQPTKCSSPSPLPACLFPAPLQAVVSDVPSCGGVSYAKEHGIAVLTYPASRKGLFPGLLSEELVAALTQTHQADFVLLAGFLKVSSWGSREGGLTAVTGWAGATAL